MHFTYMNACVSVLHRAPVEVRRWLPGTGVTMVMSQALATELRSSARATSTLNHGAISPVFLRGFCFGLIFYLFCFYFYFCCCFSGLTLQTRMALNSGSIHLPLPQVLELQVCTTAPSSEFHFNTPPLATMFYRSRDYPHLRKNYTLRIQRYKPPQQLIPMIWSNL